MQNSKTKITLHILVECKMQMDKELMTTNTNYVFVQLVWLILPLLLPEQRKFRQN